MHAMRSQQFQRVFLAVAIAAIGLVTATHPAFAAMSPAAGHGLGGLGMLFGIGQLSPAGARVIDPIITEVVQGYRFPNLVGSVLFPEVPVSTRGGQVIQFGPEAFRRYNARRAPGAATKRVDFGYLGDKFALVQDALEGKVPFEVMEDAQRVPHINLAQVYLRGTVNILKKSLEADQAALALDPNNYDANHKVALAGTSKWSDPSSNPTQDIDDYKETVRTGIGVRPNVLVMSAQAYKAARTNPNIVDRFKYTSKESITADMLAQLWDLDKVAIGDDIYWDDSTGQMVDVWGNNAVLAYSALAASSNQEPSYGYTYRMIGHPMAEIPYQDRNARSWIYPVNYERVPVNSAFSAGFLIQTPA